MATATGHTSNHVYGWAPHGFVRPPLRLTAKKALAATLAGIPVPTRGGEKDAMTTTAGCDGDGQFGGRLVAVVVVAVCVCTCPPD